jgi:type I restriction enzyme M protein
MTDHTANLHVQLWDIANTLRGEVGAHELRDYILGFIFCKYLSERMNSYADELLKPDGKLFAQLQEGTAQGDEYLKAI